MNSPMGYQFSDSPLCVFGSFRRVKATFRPQAAVAARTSTAWRGAAGLSALSVSLRAKEVPNEHEEEAANGQDPANEVRLAGTVSESPSARAAQR